ncbi:hypothetical protein ACL02U_29355 [Streptomyces sp. MS06]|uniref:hypothetical protein n=1 Tax=Streptomyces sp. MS06 TaxID=3385974 RepID=UPI00399F80E0
MVSQMVLGSDLNRGNGRRGHGRRGRVPRTVGRGTAFAAALALIVAPVVTACSDSGGGSSASPSSTSPTATGATAPADLAAAEQQVKKDWQTFFDPASSLQQKQDVLENGDRMAPVLQAFSGDQRGGQVQANVTAVEFTSPTQATVTYDLTLNGATALPNASGTAVLQDGTWKVSASTLCALVAMSGNASASALPGC